MQKSTLYILLTILITLGSFSINAECTNGTAYLTTTAPTDNNQLQISTCTFQSEYNTITGISAGETYLSDMDLGGCINVHSGTFNGPVVASGNLHFLGRLL